MALHDRSIRIDESAASGAQSVLLIPAHQSPAGGGVAPDRRHALIE
jgi:hypothetical protein